MNKSEPGRKVAIKVITECDAIATYLMMATKVPIEREVRYIKSPLLRVNVKESIKSKVVSTGESIEFARAALSYLDIIALAVNSAKYQLMFKSKIDDMRILLKPVLIETTTKI